MIRAQGDVILAVSADNLAEGAMRAGKREQQKGQSFMYAQSDRIAINATA